MSVSDDHVCGQRDGLRPALAVLAAEEAKWFALLGESRSWRTDQIREVRHKTLQVAQQRVQTVLNRLSPKEAVVLNVSGGGTRGARALTRVTRRSSAPDARIGHQ